MKKETLRKNLREIPDFPKPGILFYDVTTLFKNSECLSGLIDELYEMYKDKGITKVVGIESRDSSLAVLWPQDLEPVLSWPASRENFRQK